MGMTILTVIIVMLDMVMMKPIDSDMRIMVDLDMMTI